MALNKKAVFGGFWECGYSCLHAKFVQFVYKHCFPFEMDFFYILQFTITVFSTYETNQCTIVRLDSSVNGQEHFENISKHIGRICHLSSIE